MNFDIVEGAIDKSQEGLRNIVLAQARLRTLVAVPIVALQCMLYGASPDSVEHFVAVGAIYCIYVLVLQVLVLYWRGLPARKVLLVTAVLDPLALSVGLYPTGRYGVLLAGFYLFTILGFGFRTGRPLMFLCQGVALVGYAGAFALLPYWSANPLIWVALAIPLIVVPLYAGTLIRRLREAREHAERESRGKSELLAKVSHELRTPLAGIISATELLANEAGGPVRHRTNTILALSDDLLREINDLLDEAKYEAGAVELASEPFDLRRQLSLLKEAMGAAAARKGIAFETSIDPAVIDHVQTDRHLLGRVLFNLVGNAVKFTERGGVALTIELLRATTESYQLRFSVTDSGVGMPESFRSRIFEPFAQVDQGTGRPYGGTGLGLTLSKRIVELMGGRLEFHTRLDQGSRFWFDLCLRRVAVLRGEAGERAHAHPLASRKRILIAEDNDTNRLLLQEMLEVDGHLVTAVASGTAALEQLAAQTFDLAMLDYNLGDMDGVRVLQTYRFAVLNPSPILFLTADVTKLTQSRLSDAGAAGILHKPVTLAKLRTTLQELDATPVDDRAGDSRLFEPPEAERPRRVLAVVPVDALDRDRLEELRSVSSHADFFPRLIAESERDIVRSGNALLVALGRGEHAAIREVAHMLKGVSANVGAMRLFALTGRMMSASREEIEAARDRWSQDLRDSLDLTTEALRQEAVRLVPAPSAGATSALHPR